MPSLIGTSLKRSSLPFLYQAFLIDCKTPEPNGKNLCILNKELIINSSSEGIDIALLEDKHLTELHQERSTNQFVVGDIFLGKIKKVMPGLNAAFIEVGHEKDAFLHYTDLSPDIRSVMKFTGQCIGGALSPEQMLNNFEIQKQIV